MTDERVELPINGVLDLHNVAAIAGQFAAPLGLAAEAQAVAQLDGSHDYLP